MYTMWMPPSLSKPNAATAKRYLKVADDAIWKRLDELVKGDTSMLKAKFRGR